MPNKELVEYIERELRRGVHIDKIKRALFDAGHQIYHVEEAIFHIRKKKKRSNAILIGAIVIGLLLLIMILYILIDDAGTVTQGDFPTPLSDSQLFSKAVRESDVSLCEDIEDLQLREKCIIGANAEKTVYTDQERSDRLMFAEAAKKSDPTLCQSIVDGNLREQCVSAISTRKIYSDQEKADRLKFASAARNKDITLCNSIVDENIKATCLSYFNT